MRSITEDLKRILTAVYGRDMRQAIHDGISVCDENINDESKEREKYARETDEKIEELKEKDNETNTKIENLKKQSSEDDKKLESKIEDAIALFFADKHEAIEHAIKDYRWYKNPTTGALASMAATPQSGYYFQNTKISVVPGDTYRITVYVINTEQETENIIAVASGSGTDNSYSDFKGLNIVLEEGVHDYYVTIPEGYNLLLVTTEDYVAGDIRIAKMIKEKIPTKTSELENDSHFLTADTEISWGRKADTTIGGRSVALGTNVEASGNYSYAEGYLTTASGTCSHAEGSGKALGVNSHAEGSGKALGDNSHAEGSGKASGYYSHAEGAATEASGYYSHAEGANTEASGYYSHAEGASTKARSMYSHAEGYLTTASGTCSHAEGSFTTAKGDAQHVQGKHNVIDESNKYAHIVGGGTSSDKRKNIHTLDWEGNAEYAGDVTATVNEKKVSIATLADIFLQPGAAAHNAIYRGRKLGNTLTSEMLASIRDSSFSNLYVGDYIETEDNIYRFMDFNYFLGCISSASGGKIEKPHAILVPDKVMGSSAIDNHPDAVQPKETHMYAVKLPEVTQTLKNIFGNDNVATMERIIPKTVNGEPTGWDWVNVGADLLSEEMVMGHSSWGQWAGLQTGILKGQLAGFRYSHSLMCSNDDYWLRDKRSATNYALISSGGISSSDVGNQQHGVRPFFVIW